MTFSILLSILGGLLLSAAFPPLNLDLLPWFAFIPLLIAMEREKTPVRASVLGFIFGLSFFSVDLRSVIQSMINCCNVHSIVATFVFLFLVCLVALAPAAFALASVALVNRKFDPLVVIPSAWIAFEYARTYLATGFPWDCVGYSQAHRLLLIQICDLTGIYGLSFLILTVNVAFVSLIKLIGYANKRHLLRISVAAVSFVVVVIYGTVRVNQFSQNGLRDNTVVAAILQGNIPHEIKWRESSRQAIFLTYDRLARESAAKGANLLIWPETSVPIIIGGADLSWQFATDISAKLKIPMLIGAFFEKRLDGHVHLYNSAFLVEHGELRQRHDKNHLVPFGEYLPFSSILRSVPSINARAEYLSAGSHISIMESKGLAPFSVIICYEAIFPDLSRRAVKSGAKFLVNITDDDCFGQSSAPYQHLAMSGFRAVENRVWLIRAANAGISAVYDPCGRLVAFLPLWEQGALVYKIQVQPVTGSFYTLHGDIFAWIIIGLLVAMSFLSFRSQGISLNI